MKSFAVLLLIVGLAVVSQAQQPSTEQPTDVVVVSSSWKQYRERTDLNASITTAESYTQRRARIREEMRSDAARNLPGAVNSQRRSSPVPASPSASTGGYQYRAVVKNNGGRTIKSISWEYQFIDPKTNEVVARHRFTSQRNIRNGESKDLEAFSISPPTKVISVESLQSGGSFNEKVLLTRIEYTDGTTWQSP